MGCSGGEASLAFRFVKQQGGINDEKSYPYTAVDGQCKFQPSKSVITDQGFAYLAYLDEKELLKFVAKFGPVSVAINANLLSFLNYESGFYDDIACKKDRTNLDHVVLIVGYGTDPRYGDYWIVVSSF